MNKKYFGRKFLLTGTALLAVIAALFFDQIESNDFAICLGVVLGQYGASNVFDKNNGHEG